MAPFFSDFLIPAFLFIIMFGIGMNLDWREFIYIFRQPKMFLIGLTAQMLLLPLLAFIIVLALPLEPVFQVGLIIVSVCPGGTSSNLITFLLKGKLALSVSLTTVNSILVLITVPLMVNLSLNMFLHESSEISLPVGRTSMNIFFCVLLPVSLGLLAHEYFPKYVQKLHKPLRYLMITLLVAVCLGVFLTDDALKEGVAQYVFLFVPALALNILGSFAGFMLARLNTAPVQTQFTLATEVGLQNTALAIFVSQALLNEPQMAMVALVYSSFSFFTTFLWAWLIKRFAK